MYTLGFVLLTAVLLIVYYYANNIHNIRGQYYSVKGQPEKALSCYKKAYDKKPNVNNTLNLGYLLLRSGDFSQAETILNSAFMLSKITEDDKERVRMMQALLSWQRGDIEGAVKKYEELHQKGENTVIYANLGFLYILQGDMERAYEFNKQAYEYNDTNNVILDNIAECCYITGDIEGAYEYLKKAVESSNPIAENYYHFARVLNARGEYEQAGKYIALAEGMTINALSGISSSHIEKLKKEIADNENR